MSRHSPSLERLLEVFAVNMIIEQESDENCKVIVTIYNQSEEVMDDDCVLIPISGVSVSILVTLSSTVLGIGL